MNEMRHKRSQRPCTQSGISLLTVLSELVLFAIGLGMMFASGYYGAKRAQEEKPEPIPANAIDYNNAVLTDWGDFKNYLDK